MESEALWVPLFVIRNNWVFGFIRHDRALVFQFALCLALCFFRLLLLSGTFFLALAKRTTRNHEHSCSYWKIDASRVACSPPLYGIYGSTPFQYLHGMSPCFWLTHSAVALLDTVLAQSVGFQQSEHLSSLFRSSEPSQTI